MASKDVSKNLFDAMSIVMNSKIQKFQYDKTIEARVVSTKQKSDGIYKVEYEDAIFDAYSNDNSRYYEGDTVYVHIPKGDFSQQKHITGRKVDIEKEPERTFTFKMPFDDFLSLEDLTYNDEKITEIHGYIANHPEHGIDNDSINYDNEVINLNAELVVLKNLYTQQITQVNQYTVNFSQFIILSQDGYTISNQYPVHGSKSYFTIIEETLAQNFKNLNELNNAVEQVKQQILLGIKCYGDNNKYFNQDEYNDILEMIGNVTVPLVDRYNDWSQNLQQVGETYQNDIQQEYVDNSTTYEQNLLNDEIDIDALRQAAQSQLNNNIQAKKEEVNALSNLQKSLIDIEDTNIELLSENGGAKGRLILYLLNEYKTKQESLQQKLIDYTLLRADQEGAKEENINWLYTWVNEDDAPCLFDQLGVQADFQTLLGDYRPRRGTYGLKLIVRGMTKPTEDMASIQRTETLYFLNTIDFYGNTYAYYNYYTQQKLFDVSQFQKLTRIDVYFWQDHRDGYDFVNEQMQSIPWRIVGPQGAYELVQPNIYVTNVKLLMGLDANSFATDKVFLYTYDNLNYGINPYLETSRDVADSRTLQFAWVHKLEDGTAELINKPEKLAEYKANIYWYQYEYGVAQDTSQYAWRQGGINWKWLENACSIDENEQQKYNLFNLIVIPDIAKAQEKYRVVLSYNNVPLRSDPLVFENIDKTVETHVDDLVNEIVFRFLREDENGNLVEDGNLDTFNVYDQSNLCIKDENNISYAAKWYYVQIWIRNNDNGGYTPLALEEKDDSFEVLWGTDELESFSMINQFVDPTVEDLSQAVLMPTSTSYSDTFNNSIIKVTKKFNIRNRLDPRYTHNNITAVVKRNGREYHLQKTLFFGQSVSMGSEYSISLHQLLPSGNCMVEGEEFAIYATVADKFGKRIEKQQYHFTWELLSPTLITKGKNDPIDGLTWKDSVWNTSQQGGYADNKISGFIRNDLPLIIRVGVTNAADYPIYQTNAFRLVDKSLFNTLYSVSVPDRVEFKADGKAPISITTPFYVSDIENNAGDIIQEYYPTWRLRQWYKPTYSNEWEELQQPDFFSLNEKVVPKKEIATNNNPQIYIEFENEKPKYDGEVSATAFENGIAVRYNYVLNYIESDLHQAEIIYQSSEQTAADTETYEAAKAKYEDYLDKLNLATSKLIPSHSTYALNPYMNTANNHSVSWYWDDSLAENYYTVIEFQNDSSVPYYMRQAIAITRNDYSSSLVNSWDGSLLVDKENNAFLSKMVSAGSKDADNRFTGVLMGDWTDNTDESIQDVGLYGFTRGKQVFGLKTDGTGFIGKVGRGQIQFDGNYALISNYDKSCYINLDPIAFDDNNIFDNRTTMGYSPYFLYAKVKKTSTASVQGEGDLLESTFWARDFMRDTANDYFIVDPNNGVLTTGGIIARYGKIGNWLISSSGLYQRHTRKDEYGNSLYDQNGYLQTDKFMYLGYPERDSALEQRIRAEYAAVITKINERKQREIEYEQALILQEVVNMLGEKYAKQIFEVDPVHYFNYGAGTLLVVNYLEECLEKFNKQYTTSENENEVLFNIIYDEDNLNTLINDDNWIKGYHKHYQKNDASGIWEPVTDLGENITIFTPRLHTEIGEGNYYMPFYTGYEITYLELLGLRDFNHGVYLTAETCETLRRMGYAYGFHYFKLAYTEAVPRNIQYPYWNHDSVENFDFKQSEYFTPIGSQYPTEWLSDDALTFREDITYNREVSKYPYVRSLSGKLTSFTVEDIQKFINILNKIYQYYLDGYYIMLQQMVDAGIASLEGDELQGFLDEKSQLENSLTQQMLNRVNRKYQTQLNEIEEQIQSRLILEDTGDSNRYAIYCGEDDILDHGEDNHGLYIDPVTDESRPVHAFFTVDWAGTMMARKGILGFNSPWIIDDNGLTQKNKYGIIYLGAPKYNINEDYNPYAVDNQGQDYNGHTTTNTIEQDQLHSTKSINYQTYDQFIMFAGPIVEATYIENTDIIDVPKHYATDLDEAYFALRADGTLFSRRGMIGSWYIGDTVLQTAWRTETYEGNIVYPYNIVFDAQNAQIRLGGGRTIIYGDGRIVLENPTSGINRSMGTIELAGYSLQGWTVRNVNLENYSLSEYDAQTLETPQQLSQFTGGSWSWAYNSTTATSYDGASYISQKIATANVNAAFGTIVNPNYFSIFEKNLDNNIEYPGIQLVTGQLADLNDGQYGVVLYPTGANTNAAVLGLPSRPWNLHAGQINAGSIKTNNLVLETGPLFIKGEKVAVEPWVWNLYLDVLNRIKALGGGGSSAASAARSAGNGIGNALTNLNGKKFIQDVTIENQYLTTVGEEFNFTPNHDGGAGDNAGTTADVQVSRISITSSNVLHGGGEGGNTVNDFLTAQASLNADFQVAIRTLKDNLEALEHNYYSHVHSFSGYNDVTISVAGETAHVPVSVSGTTEGPQ